MAARQLAAWEEIAVTWATYMTEGDPAVRCASCNAGIYLAFDRHGKAYQYAGSQIRAHIVLHLRTRHPDLDPDKAL